MRLNDATLTALDAAAHAGCAHPVDVIRLVDEVRELRKELNRVVPLLAVHGMGGYRMGPIVPVEHQSLSPISSNGDDGDTPVVVEG